MTPYFIRFLAVTFAAAAILLTCRLSHADDAAAPPDHVTIPNAAPAGPNDFGDTPVMWLGVKSCGEYVVWLVFPEHISVVDAKHHPKDLAAFMYSLEHSKIPSDFRVIPCTGASL